MYSNREVENAQKYISKALPNEVYIYGSVYRINL